MEKKLSRKKAEDLQSKHIVMFEEEEKCPL
jgi:hypothetical protein